MTPRIAIGLLASAGALSLAACRIDTPTGNLHSDRSGTYAAAAPAPPAYPAQAAYPAPAAPAAAGGYGATAGGPLYDGYALAARARAFDEAVNRRRPAYAFRYADERPLVWRTADDWSMYAEPIDGGYRDYYYAPRADHPYFVRDEAHGYGYAPDGRLVAVYDTAGELLPGDVVSQVAAPAADYFLRARRLRPYGLGEDYRIPVSDDYWAGLAPGFYGAQPWLAAPRHDNGRHLGWYKHRAQGWNDGGGGRDREGVAVAYAQPGFAHGGGGKGGEGHGGGHEDGHGHGGGHAGHGGGRGAGDHGEGKGHGRGHGG